MVKQERIRTHNVTPYQEGSVLYWMSRDIRAEDNWALLYAQEYALKRQAPLLVLYNLDPSFLGGGARQLAFKLEALKSVEKQLKEKNIPFFVVTGSKTEEDVVSFVKEKGIGVLITDFSPLKLPRAWVEYVQKRISIPFHEVDAHNVVPCWVASPKQEFGAYTLRPKLYKLLPEYLEEYEGLKVHPHPYGGTVNAIPWDTFVSSNTNVQPVTWIQGDHASAKKALDAFIDTGLERYGSERNDPNARAQSNLSPYLHYGILSAASIALAVVEKVDAPIQDILEASRNKAKIDPKKQPTLLDNAGAFLEELIVRRELSDNFCFYNSSYDSVEGFPEWALRSHAMHRKDKREYLYTLKEFEEGRTHEALWNAAQLEMVKTGKMHGYMRMYWAKKILEWTESPEEAMKVAIYLNDTYELDGRDPNGYAGIAWSIGGVHDRAWFERPVFGQIRYMNANGAKSKFDTDAYIAAWTGTLI